MNCSECGELRGDILMGDKTLCGICFDSMYEKMVDEEYQRRGMINAGWRETKSGVLYYPDDDSPNVIHLSY